MSRVVIEVNNLGKQYRLGQVGTTTIVDDFTRWIYKMRGKEDPFLKIGEENDRSSKGNSDYVWALKDINFSVKQGEVLGIIGKNGAGKSTLLKILSRTTLPTTGEYKIKGRVASLLEVGTGFHPDLTGRENVFLNGAILGMTKKEIKNSFDEIVDFSGVERYIDTPVKRYSSGMYVRLAFAVAAHLQSEILIVDEVLAVGDADFQKKCLGKMKDVSGHGRTVLFVSHNIDAINSLCTQGIYLKNGLLKFAGKATDTIAAYLTADKNEKSLHSFRLSGISKKVEITAIRLKTENELVEFGKNISVEIDILSKYNIPNAQIVVGVYNYLDTNVALCYLKESISFEANKSYSFHAEINTDYTLTPGDYKLSVGILQGDFLESYESMDIIHGFPYFKIAVNQTSIVSDLANIYKWQQGWGSILLKGSVKRI